jgi:hypothetical protein
VARRCGLAIEKQEPHLHQIQLLASQLLKPHIALAMAVSLGLNLLLMPLLAAGLLPFLIPDADGRYILGLTIAAALLALGSPLARTRWWRRGSWVRSS